eukprot:1557105-Pleurochrysis_carterae.AAC.1
MSPRQMSQLKKVQSSAPAATKNGAARWRVGVHERSAWRYGEQTCLQAEQVVSTQAKVQNFARRRVVKVLLGQVGKPSALRCSNRDWIDGNLPIWSTGGNVGAQRQ